MHRLKSTSIQLDNLRKSGFKIFLTCRLDSTGLRTENDKQHGISFDSQIRGILIMGKVRLFIISILMAGISEVFFSCSKEEYCSVPVVAYMKIGFYSLKNGVPADTSVHRFTAYGVTSDSLLMDSASNVKSIELPLANNSDSSRFVFIFTVEIPAEPPDTVAETKVYTDTVGVVYSRRMYLISPLCGFGYDYYLQDAWATHNYIDSLFITTKEVIITNENIPEHIHILF
jgi:hypothetical protein